MPPVPGLSSFRSLLTFALAPKGLVVLPPEAVQLVRDDKVADNQSRTAPLRVNYTGPFPPSLSLPLEVYTANVTQQIIGIHVNMSISLPTKILSWGVAISRDNNPAIISAPSSEDSALFEEFHSVDGVLAIKADKVYPQGIGAPMGRYLNAGEKLWILGFYTTGSLINLPGFFIGGTVNIDFYPTGRQQRAGG